MNFYNIIILGVKHQVNYKMNTACLLHYDYYHLKPKNVEKQKVIKDTRNQVIVHKGWETQKVCIYC